MNLISFETSPELNEVINKLVTLTNSSSKSELFRRAIALIKGEALADS